MIPLPSASDDIYVKEIEKKSLKSKKNDRSVSELQILTSRPHMSMDKQKKKS